MRFKNHEIFIVGKYGVIRYGIDLTVCDLDPFGPFQSD